jgi:hypothetical protein
MRHPARSPSPRRVWSGRGGRRSAPPKSASSAASTPIPSSRRPRAKWRFTATYSGGVLGPTTYLASKSGVKGVTVK